MCYAGRVRQCHVVRAQQQVGDSLATELKAVIDRSAFPIERSSALLPERHVPIHDRWAFWTDWACSILATSALGLRLLYFGLYHTVIRL